MSVRRTRKEIVVMIPSGSSAAVYIDLAEGGTDENGVTITAAEAYARMGAIFNIGILGDTAGMGTETLAVTSTSVPMNGDVAAIDRADNYQALPDRSQTAIVLDPTNSVVNAFFDGPVTGLKLTPSGTYSTDIYVVLTLI